MGIAGRCSKMPLDIGGMVNLKFPSHQRKRTKTSQKTIVKVSHLLFSPRDINYFHVCVGCLTLEMTFPSMPQRPQRPRLPLKLLGANSLSRTPSKYVSKRLTHFY